MARAGCRMGRLLWCCCVGGPWVSRAMEEGGDLDGTMEKRRDRLLIWRWEHVGGWFRTLF